MRVLDQPAYVLHHRPFRDTSQIIDVITRDHGRLSLMSRGTRSAKSRTKGVLQAFTPLLIGWSGKGEMPNLNSVEAIGSKQFHLTGNALPSSLYINELLVRLLPKHDVYENVFYLYESVLALLSKGETIEPVLRLFEKQLLEALGFGLNLIVDAESGESVSAEAEYGYYLEHGPVSMMSIHDDQYIAKLSGQSLLDFQNNTLQSQQSLSETKRLMRSVMNYYLQGKPLKSRELFRR